MGSNLILVINQLSTIAYKPLGLKRLLTTFCNITATIIVKKIVKYLILSYKKALQRKPETYEIQNKFVNILSGLVQQINRVVKQLIPQKVKILFYPHNNTQHAVLLTLAVLARMLPSEHFQTTII